MFRLMGLATVTALVALGPVQDTTRVSDGPSYSADGQLMMPAKYREWVFLGPRNRSFDPAFDDRRTLDRNSLIEAKAMESMSRDRT